ncbi:MAG: dihydrofolate reductase [Blastochloris sp.]|nr:dihydrofolate reductase [Blastochloris sp.]
MSQVLEREGKCRRVALAAMASNRVIGREGKLPWHLPEDLKFFKQTTMGHPILFGKTTFEGLGRVLPKRRNLVLSRSMEPVEGVEVLRSLEQVLALEEPLLFCLWGGGGISSTFPAL